MAAAAAFLSGALMLLAQLFERSQGECHMHGGPNWQSAFVDLKPAVVYEVRRPQLFITDSKAHKAAGNLCFDIECEVFPTHHRWDVTDLFGAQHLAA